MHVNVATQDLHDYILLTGPATPPTWTQAVHRLVYVSAERTMRRRPDFRWADNTAPWVKLQQHGDLIDVRVKGHSSCKHITGNHDLWHALVRGTTNPPIPISRRPKRIENKLSAPVKGPRKTDCSARFCTASV